MTSKYEYLDVWLFGKNKAKQSQFLYHWFRLLFIMIAPFLLLRESRGEKLIRNFVYGYD